MAEPEKKEHAEKIDFSMFKDEYFSESLEGFQRSNEVLMILEKDPSRVELLEEVFRALHTLKSSSNMLDFADIGGLAHLAENMLDRMRKRALPVDAYSIGLLFRVVDTLEAMVKDRVHGSGEPVDTAELSAEISILCESDSGATVKEVQGARVAGLPAIDKIQSIKVHVSLLDMLFDQIGEMVISKNRLDNLLAGKMTKDLKVVMTEMDRLIGGLQENISAARMLPIDEIFQKFPRMVRDLAKEEGKEIDLVIEGREIDLDKAILDSISEPIIHLLRNAVAHGIEPKAERLASGKPPIGTIRLTARSSENHVLISVEEDGRGIDVDRVRAVAVSKGYRSQEEVNALSNDDVIDMLFESGFSSLDRVSGLSGRGVGLDIVKTSAMRLGGVVEVSTQPGKGTRFTLRLPQVVAVMQTLMVGVGDYTYAIPSDIVTETVNVTDADIKMVGQDPVLVLRGEVIPFVKLGEMLDIPHSNKQEEIIAIILKIGDKYLAVGVETLMDITENIIKPFDTIARQFKGFTGGAILGDGRVALLLNIPTLLNFKTLEKKVGVRS